MGRVIIIGSFVVGFISFIALAAFVAKWNELNWKSIDVFDEPLSRKELMATSTGKSLLVSLVLFIISFIPLLIIMLKF